jgi:hypothetical protein
MSETVSITLGQDGKVTYVWSVMAISLPFYRPIAVSVVRRVAFDSPDPAASRVSNAIIIGVATGSALVLALLAGGAVYVVRSRKTGLDVGPADNPPGPAEHGADPAGEEPSGPSSDEKEEPDTIAAINMFNIISDNDLVDLAPENGDEMWL